MQNNNDKLIKTFVAFGTGWLIGKAIKKVVKSVYKAIKPSPAR